MDRQVKYLGLTALVVMFGAHLTAKYIPYPYCLVASFLFGLLCGIVVVLMYKLRKK